MPEVSPNGVDESTLVGITTEPGWSSLFTCGTAVSIPFTSGESCKGLSSWTRPFDTTFAIDNFPSVVDSVTEPDGSILS